MVSKFNTRAILFGDRSLDIIAASLRESPNTQVSSVEVRRGSASSGWLGYCEKGSSEERWIFMFDGANTKDDLEIYSGDRTLIACGDGDKGAPFIKSLVGKFGGFYQHGDGGWLSAWEAIPPTGASEITPQQRLQIELCYFVEPKVAESLRVAIHDSPDATRDFVRLITEYGVMAATAPGMKP